MAKRLILAEPGKVAFEEFDPGTPGPGQVRAKAVLSGISHGTEMTSYLGKSPFIKKVFTGDRVFRDMQPGDTPFYPFRWCGYDMVGEVTAVGAGVTAYRPGDRVFIPIPHQTEFVFAADNREVFKLAPATRPGDAIMLSLGVVALCAIHDAEIKLGDSVAVFGGGIVGQLTAQQAVLSGARRVFLVEPSAERRARAVRQASVTGVDPAVELPAIAIRRENGGQSPDVVLECSGNVKGLAGAVQAAGVGGTVVAVGFYAGGAADLSFGEEFLHNRITLKASMGVWGCPSRWPQLWNREREMRQIMDLIEGGRLNLEGFLSATVPFAEAAKAYEMIKARPELMRVAFSYA